MNEPQVVGFEESEINNIIPSKKPEVKEESETIKRFKRTERTLIIIFCISVPLFFATPWIFTRTVFHWLNFTETGNIGSTIGGITAPFFSLLASVIVYFSFRAQIQMNITQQERMDAQEEEKKYEKQKETMMTLSKVIFNNAVSLINLFITRFSDIYEKLEKVELKEIDYLKNYSERDIESLLTDYKMIYNLLHPIWYLDSLDLLKRDDKLLLYSLDAVKWDDLEKYLEKSIKVFNSIMSQTDHRFDKFREEFRYKPKLEIYHLIISSLTN